MIFFLSVHHCKPLRTLKDKMTPHHNVVLCQVFLNSCLA